MNKRCHIYISGLVQGVGFRFTARYLANRYRVKGWARNLGDGRVELEAEGDSESLNDFLRDLRGEFGRNITDFELEELPTSGEYSSFEIRF